MMIVISANEFVEGETTVGGLICARSIGLQLISKKLTSWRQGVVVVSGKNTRN